MNERAERVREAFGALGRGDFGAVRDLFAEDGQWLGVPGSGFGGTTPI
jgi:ketosteroid isomerase-like protein